MPPAKNPSSVSNESPLAERGGILSSAKLAVLLSLASGCATTGVNGIGDLSAGREAAAGNAALISYTHRRLQAVKAVGGIARKESGISPVLSVAERDATVTQSDTVEPESAEPESPEEFHLRADNMVFLTASVGKGMASRINGNPVVLSQKYIGMKAIARIAVENRRKIRRKQMCVILGGGNDVSHNDDIDRIIKYTKATVAQCIRAKAEEIAVLTRLPYDKDLKKKFMKERIMRLRDALLAEFASHKQVTVVDLFAEFSDENGDLKEKYVERPNSLHQTYAYEDAMRFVLEQMGVANVDGLIRRNKRDRRRQASLSSK